MHDTGGDTRERTRCAVPLIILAAVACVFWLPAAVRVGNWGDDMWHRAFMLAGAARRTILLYRQFPFWNPYMSGGAPFLANPASSFLSPTFLVVLAAGVVSGLKLRVLLALWIGLCGGYFLGRRIAPGRCAPYLCAFTFMLGSWYPLYMSHWHDEFIPFVYMPWLLLFFFLGVERVRWCVPAGFTIVLMIFEGGAYPVPYAMLFIALYAAIETLRLRRLAPLRALIIILALAVLVSGLKLLPSLDLHFRYPRPTYWYEPVLPWSALQRMVWGRDQSAPSDFRGSWLGWWEYGMYVGILPSVLAAFGALFLWRRSCTVTVLGLFFGAIMFGDSGALSLWHWVHTLPVFCSLHDPIRFRILLVLCLSILAAMALSSFEQKQARWKSPRLNIVLVCGTVWVLIDMCLVNGRIYAGISSRPPLIPTRWGEFRQRKLPKEKQQGPLSFLFFLQNEGLVNNYEPLEFPDAGVMAFGEPGYRGEVWLAQGKGKVAALAWRPNRLSYTMELTGADILVVNQRYDPGWKAGDGRLVFSRGGLIALSVSPADKKINLRYVPPLFYPGCVLSVLGTLVACVVWKKG